MQRIKHSSLRKILTPEDFFNTDIVMYVDLLPFEKAETEMIEVLRNSPNCFFANGKPYYFLSMCGSPQNLFLNVKDGVNINYGGGYIGRYYWPHKNLPEILRNGYVFDFTEHHLNWKQKKLDIQPDPEWVSETFFKPYQQ